MGGIVGHVQVEGLPVGDGVVERLERLAGQGFRQENVVAVVFGHVLDGGHVPEFRLVAEIVGAEVAFREAGVGAGDVHEEAPVVRGGSRGAGGGPVRLAHMDGVVARVAEEADHRRRHLHVRRGGESLGAEAVDVPFRAPEDVRVQFLVHGGAVLAADGVGGLVLGHGGPVGDVAVGGVHPGHDAGPGRGRDRAGVGLGQDDALSREPFHVRGVELESPGVYFLSVGDRTLRPSVVVHEEECSK